MATTAAKKQRRTQAERRETTRAALLDAAIECLVQDGYARTTTRGIAKRAGVTPGALQHHFSSKGELLGETIGHLRAKVAGNMLTFAQSVSATPIRKREELLLDRMWRIYRGPVFVALLELAMGARTDPELRKHIAGSHEEMMSLNRAGGAIMYPEFADRPELVQLIVVGQATMRGLALAGLAGEWDPDEVWPLVRTHMLAMNATVLGDPS